jgi:hypothetical protein
MMAWSDCGNFAECGEFSSARRRKNENGKLKRGKPDTRSRCEKNETSSGGRVSESCRTNDAAVETQGWREGQRYMASIERLVAKLQIGHRGNASW